jgi:autotransporter strand-loop-strand O-heptosyltransferase
MKRSADDTRPIREPYVCIAVQSTLQAKFWNNPTGWREVVAFLKEAGYRVICIDQKSSHGQGLIWTHIPAGAEDMTGDHPLVERARFMRTFSSVSRAACHGSPGRWARRSS